MIQLLRDKYQLFGYLVGAGILSSVLSNKNVGRWKCMPFTLTVVIFSIKQDKK